MSSDSVDNIEVVLWVGKNLFKLNKKDSST